MAHRIPEISEALLEYLEQVYPDHVVNPEKKDPMLAYGEQGVIRHLRFLKENETLI